MSSAADAAPPVAQSTSGETLLQEYRRFMPLFRNLVRREIRQKYKGSLLGLLWTLATPIVMILTYSAVFHYIFRVIDIPHYSLFLVSGLAVWTLSVGGMLVATNSLVANASIVKKIRFPREMVPTTAVLSNAVTAGALFVIAIVLGQFISVKSHVPMVALPIFLLFLLMFTLGMALMLAAVNVYLRDVAFIFEALTMPWFFLTPIFYTFETLGNQQVPEWVVELLYYANPMTPYVWAIRRIVFDGVWPTGTEWIYCAIVGALTLVVGIRVFRRLEREMAVVL